MVSIYLIRKVNEAFPEIVPGTGLRFGIQDANPQLSAAHR